MWLLHSCLYGLTAWFYLLLYVLTYVLKSGKHIELPLRMKRAINKMPCLALCIIMMWEIFGGNSGIHCNFSNCHFDSIAIKLHFMTQRRKTLMCKFAILRHHPINEYSTLLGWWLSLQNIVQNCPLLTICFSDIMHCKEWRFCIMQNWYGCC